MLLRATHLCHSEEQSDVRISRKGHHITNPTQDTFVLAWRKGAHEQKSERYRSRKRDFKSEVCAVKSEVYFLTKS